MKNVPQYRIEERYTLDGIATQWVTAKPAESAEAGYEAMQDLVRRRPIRYTPHSPYRLVLVGPDHTTLPSAADPMHIDRALARHEEERQKRPPKQMIPGFFAAVTEALGDDPDSTTLPAVKP